MADQVETRPRRLAEATILAGISFAGYAVAFGYEAGFLSRYHIPFWLIQVSLTQVFGAIAILTAIAWYAASPLALPAGPWWAAFRKIFLFVVLVMLWGFAVSRMWQDIHKTAAPQYRQTNWALILMLGVGGLILLAVQAIGWFVQPILMHSGSIVQRIATGNPQDAGYRRRSVLSLSLAAWERAGYPAFVIYTACYYLVYFILVAGLVGLGSAYSQQEFVVRTGTPECIVVRSYGTNLICVELAPSRRVVTPRFRLVPLGDSAGERYVVERLGHLTVMDPVDTLASGQ
jgi:hypothetical protein